MPQQSIESETSAPQVSSDPPVKQFVGIRAAIIHNHPIHYKHLLLSEMTRLGLDFTVLFMGAQSTIRREKIPFSQSLYKAEVAYDGPYETAPTWTRMSFVYRALQRLRPNVLIISGNYAMECWVGWLWALLHRVPIILWFESNEFDFPRHFPKETLKRIFLLGCVGAHVYGKSNRAYLHKLGMPLQNILVKRAVVDVDLFSTPPDRKPAPQALVRRLIYLGRLSPEKNLAFLVKAFAQEASQPHPVQLELTLAGYGPCERELRDLVTGLNIGHCVRFTGAIPQKDLPPVLRDHDILVLPSTREPWGLVGPEAMLCRLPVLLSTQCGCAADLVTPDTGWTFNPWNPAELSARIADIRRMPPHEIVRMGAAAFEIGKHYSAWESAAAILAGVADVRRKAQALRQAS